EQVWIGAPAIAVIEVIAVFRLCRLFSRRNGGSGNEAELLCQHPEGVIPVLKSGPDVYLPSKAPSGTFVSPLFHRLSKRFRKLRRTVTVCHISRIQGINM